MIGQSVGSFILKEDLHHPSYSWPDTLIFYPVRLSVSPEEIGDLVLKDQNGDPVLFQLTDVRRDGEQTCATAAVVTDMPCRAEKDYTFYRREPYGGDQSVAETTLQHKLQYQETEEEIILHTSGYSLHIRKKIQNAAPHSPVKTPIFRIRTAKEGICGNAFFSHCDGIQNYTAEICEKGSLFADCVISVEWEGERFYELKIRITEGMDFLELDETMRGFREDEKRMLVMEWENFRPESRYCRYRNREKIDAYLQDDGYLPFRVSPYDSWVSWWNVKTASFRDREKGISVGTFIRNAGDWDDGTYAVWRSPDRPALRFRLANEGRLCWEYPMISGTRSMGLAVFPAGKETEAGDSAEDPSDARFITSYVDRLWFWHEFIDFNKVRKWVLRWEEDQSAYPRFFPEDSIPETGTTVWHYGRFRKPFTPAFMEKMVYELSHAMNHLDTAGAVPAREFSAWICVFDMAAPKMGKEQFDDIRACCAFAAYAYMDENFMPVKNLLSGHPNFLVDARAVAAKMAALFPDHPDAKLWAEQFERAMALNLKYHVRPDVKTWNSKGGRWTENLGCYNFAALTPMLKTQALLRRSFGENVLLCPNFVKWADYMLNALSAPVDGVRTFPPQGAHSGAIQDPIAPPYTMNLLSDALFRYEPMLAEYWQYLSDPCMRGFEERNPGDDMYRFLAGREYSDRTGTRPALSSSKFTGYGYVLRAEVGEEREVSVHLEQIDEGPNYRWGRAGQGGCGMIHYYAQGKRYSYNRPEDVGDDNMGDVQACCNFGVLAGHEFKSVGRNDLTEPLYDFGFAQFAQVDAGPYSRPFYRSRSVLLSGSDYFVVYDEVGDMRVYGRFAWFVKEGEPFPDIVQLKPGAAGKPSDGGTPVDSGIRSRYGNVNGKLFDGMGNFLTLVTHRKVNTDYNMYAHATEYGAKIDLQGRTDYIFRDGSQIRYRGTDYRFTGTAGIVRLYGRTKAEAALFRGSVIGALGVTVTVSGKNRSGYPRAGLSFTVENRRIFGKIQCEEDVDVVVALSLPEASGEYKPGKGYHLCIDGIRQENPLDDSSVSFTVGKGSVMWEITDSAPTPRATRIVKTVVASENARLFWEPSNGAQGYEIELSTDGGKTWENAATVQDSCSCTLTQLKNGRKYHARVQAFHRDRLSGWSGDYPLYITDQTPDFPEGLRVWKRKEGFDVLWGKELGVDRYRLYRRIRDTGDFELVYEGEQTTYSDRDVSDDTIYEYAISAINGNGEGPMSGLRDTAKDGPAFWDPEPDVKFRRYLPSHEYGYQGFDHWKSYRQKELDPYPE